VEVPPARSLPLGAGTRISSPHGDHGYIAKATLFRWLLVEVPPARSLPLGAGTRISSPHGDHGCIAKATLFRWLLVEVPPRGYRTLTCLICERVLSKTNRFILPSRSKLDGLSPVSLANLFLKPALTKISDQCIEP
jgi:hypothetical protein